MADQIEEGKNVEEAEDHDAGIANADFCSGDPIGNANLDLGDLYEYKRNELDKIHHDLNDLIDRLNTFVVDQDGLSTESEDDLNNKGFVDDCSEKQDGPQEKELIKQKYAKVPSSEEIYVCDGEHPPEIDWEMLAPFIQSVVGDLRKIRQLNQLTNSVMERIRCLTDKNDVCQDDDN